MSKNFRILVCWKSFKNNLEIIFQINSLRSDDLVVPKLPACGCEWWWRLVSPSTGGDWWATCHVESCARYSRLQCSIGVSPLLPLPCTGRAASGGALAPEPPCATRIAPEPIRKVPKKLLFFTFLSWATSYTQQMEMWVEQAQPKHGKHTVVGILGQYWPVWKNRVTSWAGSTQIF